MLSTKPSKLKAGGKDSEGGIYDGDRLLRFYNPSASEYQVKDGTKIICDAAFHGTNLSTIILPETVEAIGEKAFADAEYLTSINIPEGVTRIPVFAFIDCTELNILVFPKTIEYVDNASLPENLEMLVLISEVQFNWNAFGDTNIKYLFVPEDLLSYYEDVKERHQLECEVIPIPEDKLSSEGIYNVVSSLCSTTLDDNNNDDDDDNDDNKSNEGLLDTFKELGSDLADVFTFGLSRTKSKQKEETETDNKKKKGLFGRFF